MTADSIFSFDTDIGLVIPVIKEGLREATEAYQKFQRETGNSAAAGQIDRTFAQIDAVLDRTASKFSQLAGELNGPKLFSAKNLTAGLRTEIGNVEQQIGRLAARRGLSIDVGLRVRKNVTDELIALSKTITNKALAAGKSPELVGNQKFYTERRRFDTGFEAGTVAREKAGVRVEAKKRTNTAAAELRSERAAGDAAAADEETARQAEIGAGAAKRAARNQVRAARNAGVIADLLGDQAAEVATPVERTPVAPKRKRQTKAEREAEIKQTQDKIDGLTSPPPVTKATTSPAQAALDDLTAATKRATEATKDETNAKKARTDPLGDTREKAPPLISGGGRGGGQPPPGQPPPPPRPEPEDPRSTSVERAIAEEESRRARLLREANDRLVARTKAQGLDEFNAEEDPARLFGEYLRGATATGATRTGGFEPGVTDTKSFIQDTRFGQSEFFKKTTGGADPLATDSEEAKRAQEAFGAAMNADQEALLKTAGLLRSEAAQREAYNLALQQSNGRSVRQGRVEGQPFAPQITNLGGGLLADERSGQVQFLQRVGKAVEDRFRNVLPGSGEEIDARAKFESKDVRAQTSRQSTERSLAEIQRKNDVAVITDAQEVIAELNVQRQRTQASLEEAQRRGDDKAIADYKRSLLAIDAQQIRAQNAYEAAAKQAADRAQTKADTSLAARQSVERSLEESRRRNEVLAQPEPQAQLTTLAGQKTGAEGQLAAAQASGDAKAVADYEKVLVSIEAQRIRAVNAILSAETRAADAAIARAETAAATRETNYRALAELERKNAVREVTDLQERLALLEVQRQAGEALLLDAQRRGDAKAIGSYERSLAAIDAQRITTNNALEAAAKKATDTAKRESEQAEADEGRKYRQINEIYRKNFVNEVADLQERLARLAQLREAYQNLQLEAQQRADGKAVFDLDKSLLRIEGERIATQNRLLALQEASDARIINQFEANAARIASANLKAADERIAQLTKQGRGEAQAADVQAVQQRLKAGRLPGERFAPGVVEVSKTEAVDTRNRDGQGDAFFRRNTKGVFEQTTGDDDLILAKRNYAKVIQDAADRALRESTTIVGGTSPGDARRRQLDNLTNLRQGAAPGNLFAENVIPLGSKYVADLRGQVYEFYQKVGVGFEKLGNDSIGKGEALQALLNQQSAESLKRNTERSAAENAARLSDPNARSGLVSSAFQYSNTGIANVVETEENGVKKRVVELYRKIGDGLHELAQGSQAYNDELVKVNKSGKGGRGILGSFVHGLTSGGFGGGGADGVEGFVAAAGTTAKYSALYSVMGLLQGALGRVGAEMVNFADSNTDLSIAVAQATDSVAQAGSVDQDYINTLEGISITAGSNVGDIQDIVAAGIRTIGLESKGSSADVKALGADFAEQAQRMAILGKTDIKDAAGNIRAISTAFQIPLSETSRINDALVTGKNVGGGDEKQTAQAVASAGEAAKSAGITLEALSAIASRIQASTDQTGAAVGNKISRILSTAGGTAGQKALADINTTLAKDKQIDLSAQIGVQLQQLSAAKDDLTDAQVKQVANVIGGTSSYKEFLTILNDYNGLINNNGKGLNQAGSAAREYKERLDDLSVTVREFQGALSAIIVNIGNSGALDDVVIGFKAVVEVLKILASLTGEFDKLTESTGKWVFRLGEVALALALIGKIRQSGTFSEFLRDQERTFRPADALARDELAKRESGAVTGAVVGAAAGGTGIGAAKTALAAKTAATVSAQQVAGAAAAATTATTAKIAATVTSATAKAASTAATVTAASAEAAGAGVAGAVITAAELAAFQAALAAAKAARAGAAAGGAAGQFESAAAQLAAEKDAGNSKRRYSAGLGELATLSGPAEGSRRGGLGLSRFGFTRQSDLVEGSTRAAFNTGVKSIGGSVISGVGGLLKSLTSPVNLAIGGFLAVGALKSKANEVGAAMRASNRTLAQLGQIGALNKDASLADQESNYRNLASDAATQKKTLDDARNSFLGRIFKSGQNDSQSKALGAEEAYATRQADLLRESINKAGTGLGQLAQFGDPATRSADDVATAFQTLADNGVSAAQRVALLNDVLSQTGKGSDSRGLVADPTKLAQGLVSDLTQLDANNTGKKLTIQVPAAAARANGDVVTAGEAAANGGTPRLPTKGNTSVVSGGTVAKQIENPLASYFAQNADKIQKLIFDQVDGIKAEGKGGALSEGQIGSIAEVVASQASQDWLTTYRQLSPSEQAEAANKPSAIAAGVYAKTVSSLRAAGNVTGERQAGTKASGADIFKEISKTVIPQYQALTAALSPGDDAGAINVLTQELAKIDAEIADVKVGDDISGILDLRNSVLYEIGAAEVAQDEKIRIALQGKAKTAKAIAAIGQTYFTKEFDEAYASGNLEAIIGVLNKGSDKQVAAVRQTVLDNITILKAQIANQKKVAYAVTLAQFGGGVSDAKDHKDFDNALKRNIAIGTKSSSAELKRQQGILGAFDQVDPDNSINTSQDSDAATATSTAEIKIARRNRNALAAAKLDAANRAVNDAKTRLKAIGSQYGKKSKEYYDGLAALNQSKFELAQAELDQQNNAALLKIDLTDPNAVAKAATADAKRRQAQAVKDADRAKLKGKKRSDYLDPFEIDVRNKEAAQASTAESEFLSNAQTSLAVGRISHATYIALLKARRDHLQAEYNGLAKDAQGQNARKKAIDSLTQTIKGAASELDGQFNLGDIKIPTVYQVRQSIKAKTAGDVLDNNGARSTAGNVVNDSSQQNLVLNGVPIEQVVTILKNMFGLKARTTTGKKRK